MVKKSCAFTIAILMLLVTTAAVEAKENGFAIGGEGSLDLAAAGGLPTSAMLLFHIPQVPLMFGVGVSSPLALAATADYWAAHGALGSVFSWYAGVGGYLAIELHSSPRLTVGGRIPIGLQVWPISQVLEIFAEVAPAVGIQLVPTAFDWHLQGAVGLRVWL